MSSQRSGKWRIISTGSVSAAIIISSEIPLFRVLVASLAPFFIYLRLNTIWVIFTCLSEAAYCIKSRIREVISSSANGIILGSALFLMEIVRVKW